VAETLRQGLGVIIVIVIAGVKQIGAADGGWTVLMLRGGLNINSARNAAEDPTAENAELAEISIISQRALR